MLHIKHRPEDLDEFYGNQTLKKNIKSIEPYQFGSRAFSFEGCRGCGKTSLAYIIAREFGASDNNIIHMQCSKIDSLREQIDRLSKTTLFGNKMVLILDELHRATPRAQEELLIPLENLSDNSLIISCTTEPEKIKKPVIDRFERYKVQPLTFKQSLSLINSISEKESIDLHKSLKFLLAKKSEGNPRRMLVGLNQIKNIEDIEEAEYLLDISSIEEDPDILKFYGILLHKNSTWSGCQDTLRLLLKNKNPVDIRVGILNITSGRLMSKYYNSSEDKLIDLIYNNLSKVDGSMPVKTDLIFSLHKIFKEK